MIRTNAVARLFGPSIVGQNARRGRRHPKHFREVLRQHKAQDDKSMEVRCGTLAQTIG